MLLLLLLDIILIAIKLIYIIIICYIYLYFNTLWPDNTAVLAPVPQVKLWAMTDKLGITPKLKSDDKELVGKPLMKRIMQAWLPAHEVRSPLPV